MGVIPPEKSLSDADVLVVLALEGNRYALPGKTPSERIDALEKIGGNVANISKSHMQMLGYSVQGQSYKKKKSAKQLIFPGFKRQ